MSELLELAARVVDASAADREIDALIWLAVTPGATQRDTIIPATETRRGWTIYETRDATGRLIVVPNYTASVDEVIGLIPAGLPFSVGYLFRQYRASVGDPLSAPPYCVGATPALALCVAALRARALMESRHDYDQ